jgi:hypothetical protein
LRGIDAVVGRALRHIGQPHGVQHGPQHIELELQDVQGVSMLGAAAEMAERDVQAVLHVPAGLAQALAEIVVALGPDPGIVGGRLVQPARRAKFT